MIRGPYLPDGTARLRYTSKRASTGAPFPIASEDFRLDIYRDGVRHRAAQLSRATDDLAVQNTAFHYAISGAPHTKAAVDGTALAAGTIPSDATGQWGVYLLSIDDAGTFTFTAGAANFTTGYDDEGAALAALPATPAGEYAVGVVTVQAADSSTWTAGADALAGGTGGTPAQATNYYTLAEQLASESPAGALTWNEDEYGTGSHELLVDIALAGGGADATSQDEVEVSLSAGTVDSVSVVGDPVGTFAVAADVLTTGVKADVTTAVPTVAQIQAELEEDGASILDTLRDRLTAARATALDEITAGRLAELDAANIPADIDTALARLTAARAGYLDNLNIGENVAGTSEVTAIQNNTRVVRVVPDVIERETRTYRVELFLYDAEGNMEAPDSAPTIELVDQDGTDLSARLDSATMTLVETGRYRAIYTSDAAHDTEQLLWAFSVVEGGVTRKYGNKSIIVDTIATDFTTADRAKLDTLHDTRITAGRAANLDEITAARLAELDAANLPADVDAVLVDTNELQGDWTDGGRLDLLLDRLITELDTARVEPGQGAPAASAKIGAKIDYLYKAWRNKSEQTSTEHKLYDDAGTTVDQKRTVADDGTTFSAAEVVTGP